jgi:hypothetical protein
MTNERKPNPHQQSQPAHHHDHAPEAEAHLVAEGSAGSCLGARRRVLLGVLGIMSRRSADAVLAERTH